MENSNQDETTPITEISDRVNHRLKVDVYHHFDDDVKDFLSKIIDVLDNPFEIQIITNGSNVPTKIVLIPGTPQNN